MDRNQLYVYIYIGTIFFQNLGTISNPFLMSLITTLVDVCSTLISFYTIERFGRRPLLIYGALGLWVCEYIMAIIGVVKGDDPTAVKPKSDSSACTFRSLLRLAVQELGFVLVKSSRYQSELAE